MRELTVLCLLQRGRVGVPACASEVFPVLRLRGFVLAGASDRIEVTSETTSSGRDRGVVNVSG